MDSLERTGSMIGSEPDARAPLKPTIALVQGDAAGVGPELMTRQGSFFVDPMIGVR